MHQRQTLKTNTLLKKIDAGLSSLCRNWYFYLPMMQHFLPAKTIRALLPIARNQIFRGIDKGCRDHEEPEKT
ncbi:MAG: hypothetical protein CVU06_12910 [Bacteroidetes bacterium HGW-Bacteroidetes-22]|nr:MAG: hypothetical protein CVU06_12910 [Bacteroidetes bacterium HGW-Bacteroidetes-22]